jgi:glycosyltransferase involved in cell wall biosynthesis
LKKVGERAVSEPRPLQILLVSRRYPPQIGGAERVMANMAEALADLGHRVTVISSASAEDGIKATADPFGAGAQAENLRVIRLYYSGRKVVGTFGYMWRLCRWICRNRPDVVYVSMLKQDALAAAWASSRCKIPILLRPEGAGLTGDMAWQKRHWMGRLVRFFCRKADGLVALSPAIRQELLAAGYAEGRISEIANGVAIPQEKWRAPALPCPLAVFVGRLAQEKGLDTLVRAWVMVVKQLPDARLRLIGAGPMESRLGQLADELSVLQSIEFAGARSDVEAELRGASCFVLPSREEGLSMALLEAMALGMPVVVTDIPGNRTLVSDGETGLLSPVDKPEAMTEQIVRSLGGSPEIMKMAEQGRELVASRFSIEAVAREHVALMRRLIG